MLGAVYKLLKTKSLWTSPSNVLPLHFKQTFLHIILIFTEGDSDGIESRLSFKIVSTLIKIGVLTYLFSITLTFYAVCMSKASEKQHEKYSLVHDNSTLLLLPEMVESENLGGGKQWYKQGCCRR